MIATACAIEIIIEDPLLPILKEDSNITKPARQIRRPGLDHNPASPRFKLLMIDFIPHPQISVFSKVTPHFRRIVYLSLRKKFFQPFFSRQKYTPHTPLSASRGAGSLIWNFSFSPISGGSKTIDPDTRGSSIRGYD